VVVLGGLVALALGFQTQLAFVRWILLAGFGVAALAGLLAMVALARRISRPLARITESVERLGEGDVAAEVPEVGPDELVLLAATLNRTRAEVASRMEAMERDRKARDAILSSLGEGVILFGQDGEVLYQNESALRLVGSRLEHIRNLTPPSLQRLVRATAAGEGSGVDAVDGPGSATLAANAVVVPTEGSVLLVLRDVTQARLVDAVRRDFVANASHELKTPVASIRALAETLGSAATVDPAAVHRFTERLEREAERLSRVISDLLDLSRLEGEPGTRAVVRFDQVVQEEGERLHQRAEEAGLDLLVRADPRLMVQGSERDLRLLVRNLVENAVQYTRPGGRIEVTASAWNGQADFTVRDTGIGIPTKDQPRVFERFYRVDRGRSRETGGTGLGLSIVKHVAETLGGSVTLDSELGTGSTFTVRLPLTAS
jgi:two-component system, OmpR family, phosphate regulon sensor histidine kinase PhoR